MSIIDNGGKDPLHFTREQLIVRYGDGGTMLNKRLLDSQNAWGNLNKIKEYHRQRLILEHLMETKDSPRLLKVWDRLYTQVEFLLQDAWGFKRDSKFHRFWNRPKCSCAKLDNEDAYPTGYYYINGGCILHGTD